MEISLLNGRFSAQEAIVLLSGLVKVKTDFHLEKIDKIQHSEEEIKHSEKRIRELEEQLREVKQRLLDGGYDNMALQAKLVVEFMPQYQNA